MILDIDDNLKREFSGDWLRISQIITNLLSNAIKFTPKGGEIKFNSSYIDNNLKIIVSDNGIGMNEEAQSKIFKPFEQADNSTTRKFGGTGLGLSIVLSLIKQMKGDIKLSSKEGEGSTFEVNIPIKADELKCIEISKKEDEIKTQLSGHVLVAEDNKTNQLLISVLLDELGLTSKIVSDGVEAVKMFGEEEFSLVLMDENMPKLNGVLAMKKIRSQYDTKTPIVSITANVMHGDKEKFLKAGMDGYISKPIDSEELYKVLKSFLSSK